jgi:hypothetical protein
VLSQAARSELACIPEWERFFQVCPSDPGWRVFGLVSLFVARSNPGRFTRAGLTFHAPEKTCTPNLWDRFAAVPGRTWHRDVGSGGIDCHGAPDAWGGPPQPVSNEAQCEAIWSWARSRRKPHRDGTVTRALTSEERRDAWDEIAVPLLELDISGLNLLLRTWGVATHAEFEQQAAASPEMSSLAFSKIRIAHANAAALSLLGAQTPPDLEAFAKIWPDLSGSSRDAQLAAIIDRLETFRAQVQFLRTDGSKMTVLYTSWSHLTGTNADQLSVSLVDISDQIALARVDAETATVGRAAVLTKLTDSLASEVIDSVSAILMNAQAGLRWLNRPVPAMEEVRSSLEAIAGMSQHFVDLLERLRTLSRRSTRD